MGEHGGRIVAKVLKSRGVDTLFTLSGGHIFSIYDGCKAEGIRIVDVRHEQTAAFAAEGIAKATRGIGVAALTAGPGVTNGMSAIAGAQANNSPISVLGGRAPEMRWGSGSLQEIDHLPFVSPLVKSAETAKETDAIAAMTAGGARPRGRRAERPDLPRLPDGRRLQRGRVRGPAAAERAAAQPPAGSRGGGGAAGRRRAPGDHGRHRPLLGARRGCSCGRWPRRSASRSSSTASAAAACPPTTTSPSAAPARPRCRAPTSRSWSACRWTSGSASAAASARRRRSIRLDVAPNALTANRLPDLDLVGDVAAGLAAIAARGGGGDALEALARAADATSRPRRARRSASSSTTRARRSTRCGSTANSDQVLDRDAIVVGDGGDFVSYAGRYINTYEPGCWMDPGPFGCLGAGPGQAIGAKVAHPDRQVCLLLGDGAFGFAGMEFETMSRHGLGVVGVMGNNGIWALEHHPMKFLYGYSVAAELRPETRYDELVETLGCEGVIVREPDELRPALEQAFASGVPTLVNVITDPEVVYPRKSNLA